MTWKNVSLHSISESVDYGHTASATDQPIGPNFLRITDIQNGQVDWESVPYCKASPSEEASSRLQDGDIVFARTGATTGKSFLLRECPERAIFASYLIRVRPNERVIPEFLARFFETSNYWNQISLNARGAAQPGVNASVLRSLQIPLPPLDEQHRIAAILDQADDLRGKRRQAMERLDGLAQAIFVEMFGDLQNPGWKAVQLGDEDIAEFQTGYPFKSEEYTTVKNSIRLCRGANVLPGRIDWTDLACWPKSKADGLEEFNLLPGDVLIAMDRPWISEGFKIARVSSTDCPAFLVQRVARLRSKNGLSNEFLFQLLKRPSFTRHCKPTETTIPHISPRDIRTFAFHFPPIELQQTFAQRIEAIAKLKTSFSGSLEKLNTLFASLQHRAFRGELTQSTFEELLALA